MLSIKIVIEAVVSVGRVVHQTKPGLGGEAKVVLLRLYVASVLRVQQPVLYTFVPKKLGFVNSPLL